MDQHTKTVLQRLTAKICKLDKNTDGLESLVNELNLLLESSEDTVLIQSHAAGVTGTIPAGYNSITIANLGDTDILINGVATPSGLAPSITAKSLQNTLPAVTYDTQASSIYIIAVM